MKLAELNQRLSHLEFLVDEVYEGERDPDANRLNRIEEELNVCSGLLTSLDRFTKINYTAFLKILKKHDKLTKYALRTMFLMRMSARPFYSEHFESQFLVLSKLYSALNSLRNGPSDTLQTREKVVRRKQKFWVHPGKRHRFLGADFRSLTNLRPHPHFCPQTTLPSSRSRFSSICQLLCFRDKRQTTIRVFLPFIWTMSRLAATEIVSMILPAPR